MVESIVNLCIYVPRALLTSSAHIFHTEHPNLPSGPERRAGAHRGALRGREEEVSPATRVREPDPVRGDHFSLFQVLPEAPRLRHVQVCLLPLPQVQESEFSSHHLMHNHTIRFLHIPIS